MFQFRRFPTYAYLIQRRLTEYCSAGFPHSVIHGSMLMCSSPWLIAACHDLLRLLMPRHSPCALSSLTSSEQTALVSAPSTPYGSRQLLRIMQAIQREEFQRLVAYTHLSFHNLLLSRSLWAHGRSHFRLRSGKFRSRLRRSPVFPSLRSDAPYAPKLTLPLLLASHFWNVSSLFSFQGAASNH